MTREGFINNAKNLVIDGCNMTCLLILYVFGIYNWFIYTTCTCTQS